MNNDEFITLSLCCNKKQYLYFLILLNGKHKLAKRVFFIVFNIDFHENKIKKLETMFCCLTKFIINRPICDNFFLLSFWKLATILLSQLLESVIKIADQLSTNYLARHVCKSPHMPVVTRKRLAFPLSKLLAFPNPIYFIIQTLGKPDRKLNPK